MRATARLLGDRLVEAAPAERLAALRVLVGAFATVFLVVRLPYLFDLAALSANRYDPVGALWWLSSPPPRSLVHIVVPATIALGAAFTLGWRHRVTGPAFGVAFLFVTCFDNSWSHAAHTENLVLLHVLALSFTRAADVWSLDEQAGRAARWDASTVAPDEVSPYGWPVRLMSLVTVATYVLAGIAKMRNGGLEWITGDVLRNHIANDNLRKLVLGDTYSVIGAEMVAHAWLFAPIAIGTMVVELGAPLALLRGRVRTVMVAAMWLFHVAIVVVMAIVFIYQLLGVAYASMLRPERLGWWVEGRLRRAGRRPAPAAGDLAPTHRS